MGYFEEEDPRLIGRSKIDFQYADWIINGDEILFVSRTAYNNANNFHDSNYITFNRIKNFRRSGNQLY